MKVLRLLSISILVFQFAPSSPAVGPLQLYTITPCRLVDTRWLPSQNGGGPVLSGGTVRSFAVHGNNAQPCGIPTQSPRPRAVALNLAVIQPSTAGFITVYKKGLSPIPSTSNLNFSAGEIVIANGALVDLLDAADYQFSVWTDMPPGAYVHLVIDVTGYYLQ